MKIGVALGSGAAKGYAHVAYLEAIDEMGINLSCISGTGLGAFIGAFYAGGMSAKEIYKLIIKYSILETSKASNFSGLRKNGLIFSEKIELILREHLPVQNFEDLRIPLKISTTNYWSKKEYVFQKGDIVPAILASLSIPGILKPLYYRDMLLFDGALVNPLPFDLLTDVDFIIAIDVIGGQYMEGNLFPNSLIDVINCSYQIAKQKILEQKEYSKKVNIYCTPDLHKFRSFWFHKPAEIIEATKKDVMKFKDTLSKADFI